MKVSMLGTLSLATGGVREAQMRVTGRCTAREALNQLAATYPGLTEKIFGEGQELRQDIALFVSGRSIRLRNGLSTLLKERDELIVLPLICGG